MIDFYSKLRHSYPKFWCRWAPSDNVTKRLFVNESTGIAPHILLGANVNVFSQPFFFYAMFSECRDINKRRINTGSTKHPWANATRYPNTAGPTDKQA